ncbi:MAG TPA: YbaK/EbsC family protein [Aggregatilineaceae bacterium]|nr:YbaK/EbsC family protein [Aggregatilineaceae bacterium]
MTEQAPLDHLRQLLDAAGADYALFEHPETVFSAEDGVQQGIGSLGEMAPTLILETEKGCFAAILSGGTRLSRKKIKKQLGLKNIALAQPDRVYELTGAEVGSVSLINPGLPTLIDIRLADVVYGGCGFPYHTLRIHRADLIRITEALVFDLADSL